MGEGIKFCKNCRWVQQTNGPSHEWLCGHPTAGVRDHLDLVTGEHRADPIPCYTNRNIGNCGMLAKYWEPAEDPSKGLV
jgi:hypothetical protein